jgi:hypothetical protein
MPSRAMPSLDPSPRRLLVLAALLVVGLLAPSRRVAGEAYVASVAENPHAFPFSGGESQSAVVPPKTKTQCPSGRVLVTDDWAPVPLTATAAADPARRPTVRWRNIAPANVLGQSGVARFFAPPQVSTGQGVQSILHDRRWRIPGADHQLVALPNGNLVYQTLAATRESIDPAAAPWFEFTSRNLQSEPTGGVMPQFGPGARSTQATWISTDCGETFHYSTEIDSFGVGHEECANPQPKAPCADCVTPPAPFDMGGTDGPNLIVDRATGRLYAIFQCVGQTFAVASGKPQLGPPDLERTYVFSSDDGGKTFANRGFYTPALWGPQAVALSDGRLALGIGAGIVIARRNATTGAFDFPQQAATVAGAKPHWSLPTGTELALRMKVGIGGNTLLAAAPGKGERLLFGFPSKVERTKGQASTLTQGFRLFLYEPPPAVPGGAPGGLGTFTELPEAITPTGAAATSAVMHVTALVAQPGGPVVVYWTDLDGSTLTARVRFRVIHEGSFLPGTTQDDLDLTLADGIPAPFALTPPGLDPTTHEKLRAYFYGDYRTAGAFRETQLQQTSSPVGVTTYRFYPVWVQPWPQPSGGNAPGGSVRFSEVTVSKILFQAPSFGPQLRRQEPDLFVGGECCDFGPVFDRDVGGLSPAGLTVRSALLGADPRLGNAKLRPAMRRVQPLQEVRTIAAPATLPPGLGEMFDRHRTNGGG